MNISPYLSHNPEAMPAWLAQHQPGRTLPTTHQLLSGRVVFYPGSGFDGQPVKLFGSAHAAHTFVYADYGIEQARLEESLEHHSRRFRGYHTLERIQLRMQDLMPTVWQPHVTPDEAREIQAHPFGKGFVQPFGFVQLLERDEGLTDSHGAARLAILFLGADGIATYDALFCQANGTPAPYGVLLQDHGFGGNYDRFDNRGLMRRIAERANVWPKLLLVAAHNTRPWTGYRAINAVDVDYGGMHRQPRSLFTRSRLTASGLAIQGD